MIAFATAVTGYAGILVDYGFAQSATKQVVVHHRDKSRLSDIFSAVSFVKLLFAAISLIIIAIGLICLNQTDKLFLFAIVFLGILGQSLLPNWLLMGKREMQALTLISSLPKIICSLLMVVSLKITESYLVVPLWNSMGFILSGFIGLAFCIKKYKLSLGIPSREEIELQLKNGYSVFLSRIYSTIGTGSNIVILGTFSSPVQVGYFAIAYKMLIAIAGIFDAFNQSYYPFLVDLRQHNAKDFLRKEKELRLHFALYSFTSALFLIALRDQLSIIFMGDLNETLSNTIAVIALALFTWPLNSLRTNILLACNREKELKSIILVASVICLALSIPFSIIGGAMGISFAILISQSSQCILLLKSKISTHNL